MNKIALIGNDSLSGESVSARVAKMLEEHFSTAVGKLVIVHPAKEDLNGLVELMKTKNPDLEIVLVDDLAAHKDIHIVNGINNAEFARSMELQSIKMVEPVIVRDEKMQFGENYRREQRYRSDRHNFNSSKAKHYRR